MPTRAILHSLPKNLTDKCGNSVTDEEAVAMSRHLAQVDGLFLGSSAAVNLVTAVRLAQKYGAGSGKVIVTILWCVPRLFNGIMH